MSERPKARLPKGFVDRRGHELKAAQSLTAALVEIFELYGFDGLETPFFEYTDALGKFLPDEDRPNLGVFSLQDDDDRWLSLRYDLTAPLARFFAENFQDLPKPYRSWRAGPVFRNEKPGPGRFRQFLQVDADIVGAPGSAADAEICMLAADAYRHIGFDAGEVVIRVNNRKLLDGILSEAVGEQGSEQVRLTVLRAIDKLDRLGLGGVEALLGEGRMDASGDFTKGAGLDAKARRPVLDFLASQLVGDDKSQVLRTIEPLVSGSAIGREGLEELTLLEEIVRKSGYGTDQIVIDTAIVRGLEYYTGPVFEAAWQSSATGTDLGSLGGGGRYDGLVARFRNEVVPATGFSVGVSRVIAALQARQSSKQASGGPVVVTVMDKGRTSDYFQMVAELRAAGIRAEAYLGGSGMKAQLKYADRRGAGLVIIQGSDEAERGAVLVKDLDRGAELAKAIDSNEAWRAERPAQVEVPRANLAAEIQAILSARGAGSDEG